MKSDIHPDYVVATVHCSCGNEFTTRATQPEIRVELCNECHPFYTGKQKLVDTGGRVERYKQRYAKTQSLKQRSGSDSEKSLKQRSGSDPEKSLRQRSGSDAEDAKQADKATNAGKKA